VSAVISPAVLDLGTCLARGAATLLAGQLVTGEVPTHRVAANGKVYAPSPFMSALVHDALACLDPGSPHGPATALAAMSPEERQSVAWTVGALRNRIRRFLRWQEEADGTWCFYGRGSTLGPDAATTACAALAVARHARRSVARERGRWRIHAHALARFRDPAGTYFTFVSDTGAGYGWISADGRRIVGFDRIVNAHVMRFLAAAGVDDEALAVYLTREIEQGDMTCGSPEHPDPVCFAHAVARAWAETPREDACAIHAALIPWLLARQDERGGFGGPLNTALATLALVDLGYAGDALDRSAHHLLTTVSPSGEWAYQPYLSGGHGSAAFTTAFALAALAACAASRGDVA
jgi:hypothetical protein